MDFSPFEPTSLLRGWWSGSKEHWIKSESDVTCEPARSNGVNSGEKLDIEEDVSFFNDSRFSAPRSEGRLVLIWESDGFHMLWEMMTEGGVGGFWGVLIAVMFMDRTAWLPSLTTSRISWIALKGVLQCVVVVVTEEAGLSRGLLLFLCKGLGSEMSSFDTPHPMIAKNFSIFASLIQVFLDSLPMIDNKKTKPPPSWSLHLNALQSSFSWSWACLSHQEKEFNSPICTLAAANFGLEICLCSQELQWSLPEDFINIGYRMSRLGQKMMRKFEARKWFSWIYQDQI